MFRKLLKSLLHKTGYTIVQKATLPAFNLMGLNNYNINTVLDVGANRGQFLEDWVRHLPKAKFYCFEPIAEEFKQLDKTAKKYSNEIIAINCAVGNINGQIKFQKNNFTPSSSILTATKTNESYFPQTVNTELIDVQIIRLDDFFEKIDLEDLREIFLKIDVQGYELEVLKGAVNVLKNTKICLLEINFDDLYAGQPTFKQIFDFLSEYGFEYKGAFDQVFHKNGHLIFSDVLFTKKLV